MARQPPRCSSRPRVGSSLMRAAQPSLVCPACRSSLTPVGADALSCEACALTFPVIAGIPDLRLVPDRYLTLEADREKAVAVDAVAGGFLEAVRAYWSMTPEVPPDLAERFSANMARGIVRGARHLETLGVVGPGDVLLDVGCGTGGVLATAGSRGATVVGIDTALRWLVIARRYLQELGVEAQLVAADGATPPFRSGTFTVVTSIETLEHAADQRGFVNGCLAMSDRPGGRCLLVAANRFSVAPEPAVRLWGVGFLPRRFAAPYVQRRRGTNYRFSRPVSLAELRALAGPRGDVHVSGMPLPPPPAGASFARGAVWGVARRISSQRTALAVTPFLALQRD